MTQNPFESPRYDPSSVTQGQARREIKAVSQGKRFINYLIDRILMTAGSFVIGLALGLVFAAADPNVIATEDPTLDILGFITGLVFVFAYFLIFELCFKRTPGKFVTGTKVVNVNGGVPSFGQILGRTACRFIPFEAFSFLFGDSTRVVGWHDRFSGTRVVKA